MKKNEISVIIVTYNGKKWISKCLTSLLNNDLPVEIIVVDNGSIDGTQDLIKTQFPQVNFIQSSSNLGFGRANNLGIKTSLEIGSEYIFLLNQDAYLFKCSLSKMINEINSNDKIGVLSPIHLAGNEEEIDKGFSDYLTPSITPNILAYKFLGKDQNLFETSFVNAAAWFVKASVFKDIGGFHPIFDHYGEDDEFATRLLKNNYKMVVSTQNFIVHDRPQNKSLNNFFKDDQMLLRRYLLKYLKLEKDNDIWHSARKDYLNKIMKHLIAGDLKNSRKILKSYFVLKSKIKKMATEKDFGAHNL
jgi:GT2 family glycosyltransferase